MDINTGGISVEVGTIVAALIAALMSLISIVVTTRGNKKNRENNEKLTEQIQNAENARTESLIDANIIWNARVEWIQNVRKVTAEYISACYKYIRYCNLKNLEKSISDIQNNKDLEKMGTLIEEKKLLLGLYFGPDGKNIEDINNVSISDPFTNDGKNELIIQLIDEINELINMYPAVIYELKEANKELLDCDICKIEGKERCPSNEYGDKFSDNECFEYRSKYYKIKCENSNKKIKLYGDLHKLTDVMRKYLKIEWNRAKNREKDK